MEGRACNESAFEAKRVMEASHTIVEIKIKTLDSQVYTCRVEKNVSVPDLKEQVALVTGVPSGSQRLICRGKVLKDEHALSAYEVEDGHTLHLVTRPAPPPSVSATLTGAQSEEQDPLDYSPLNRPGHISHSVLVGTFNIPDRGNVVFPEINRIFSSVLSSLRVGSFFPPTVGIGNGNAASVLPNTANPFSSGQGREVNADQRPEQRTVDQPTTATYQSGSGDVGLSIDGFPSLHGDAGYIGAIPVPAVSHVRIVHQIVPNALRTMSQHVNRMEQIFAANGQAQTSVSNIDAQSQPNEQGQSSLGGDGDPAAWASTVRRIQDLLSNQAGFELRRLADRLEAESSLETASARGSILSTGMLLDQLGRLLLDLGGTILTRGREPSQPGGGLDLRTEVASRQGAEPMHFVEGDDIPGNMDIHIHAGLPPFLVARNFLSQAAQDGPTLSLNIDGTRDPTDFHHDQATNGNTNVFMQPSSLGTMPPPASLNEHGAMIANMPELFQDPSLDSANAGRGVFYPLLARFQQLNPSLFSRQEELSLDMSGTEEGSSVPRDSNSGQHHYPGLSVLQAVVQNQLGQMVGDGEAGCAVGEQLIPATSLHLERCNSQPDIGIARNGIRSTGEQSLQADTAVGSDAFQDLVRPLLHVLEASPTVVDGHKQPKSDQAHASNESLEQADAETSLQLKCSGQTPVNMALREQACTRESQDCGRMEEVITTLGRGTVLQDFLSTLACRKDERSDAELASDQIPQGLSLVLDNVENRGLCLDSPGSNAVEVTALKSPREGSKQEVSHEIGFDTLGACSGLQNFQDGTERIAMGNNSGCSLQQSTSREDSKDLRHLFPVAHISNRQFLSDSVGLHANQLENGRAVGNAGLFGTSMDNERLLKLQQLSTSAANADNNNHDDLKRHIADSSHDGLQALKRQKML